MFPRRRIGGSQHSRVGSNRSLRMLDPEAPVSPPSARLFALEARGLFSIGALLAAGPLLASARRGEPQAVIVLPGLNTTDRSTVAIRCYLRVLGYQTSGWKLGRNDRPAGVDLPAVAAQIRSLHASSGTPVSVVGLSRGGIIAREATRMAPNSVRLVITMGSPFAAPAATNVVAGWRLVTGERLMAQSPEGLRRLADPLPVPSTSIYSRSDGIVAWQACRQAEGPFSENVEVRGPHIGLGFNPAAFWVIADRLAQPLDRWTPFRPSAHAARFLPGDRSGD